MGVTVGVNNLSVVHKSSSGVTIAFPDVCKNADPGRTGSNPLSEHRQIVRHGQRDQESQVRRQSGLSQGLQFFHEHRR